MRIFKSFSVVRTKHEWQHVLPCWQMQMKMKWATSSSQQPVVSMLGEKLVDAVNKQICDFWGAGPGRPAALTASCCSAPACLPAGLWVGCGLAAVYVSGSRCAAPLRSFCSPPHRLSDWRGAARLKLCAAHSPQPHRPLPHTSTTAETTVTNTLFHICLLIYVLIILLIWLVSWQNRQKDRKDVRELWKVQVENEINKREKYYIEICHY